MRARELRAERLKHGWGQVEASRRLGVSQPYLALLEEGKRRLRPELARKAALVYGVDPARLPLPERFALSRQVDDQHLVGQLSSLDYPHFAYVRSHSRKKHPAEVLLTALAAESLDGRVAESLPWLLLRYWQMDLKWLVDQAKLLDLQNRLGFVATLARELSEKTADQKRTNALLRLENSLRRSLLARGDYFPRPPRNNAEQDWLKQNRSQEARHWNLLSDLRPEHLQYAE